MVAKRLKKKPLGESGVSPVIGVILMVAITVILAAVVFYLVSTLAKEGEGMVPRMTFQSDDGGDSWMLTHSPKNLVWADFTVKGCTTVPTGAIEAGDLLEGCSPPVTVIDEESNTVVWTSGAV